MIHALGYRVLVLKDEVETTTESGIVLVVDEKLEKHAQNIGTVVNIGDKAFKAFSNDYTGQPWVVPGDRVIFSKYAGTIVVDPGTAIEYTLLNDEDIAAVIRNEEEDNDTTDD